jgi:Fms-interacting protein/Thoc5
MPLQAHDEAHANAEYLPRALFVLYVEMIAYKHASKRKFDVRINGNVEDAKAMALNAADNKEEEEEKDERDEEEHGRKSKKSRHRQKSIAATRTTGLKKLTATHPMRY